MHKIALNLLFYRKDTSSQPLKSREIWEPHIVLLCVRKTQRGIYVHEISYYLALSVSYWQYSLPQFKYFLMMFKIYTLMFTYFSFLSNFISSFLLFLVTSSLYSDPIPFIKSSMLHLFFSTVSGIFYSSCEV